MMQRTLGRGGPVVSAIGMGCAPLSVPDGRPGEAEAIRVVHAALDLGVTLFDTADCYGREGELGHNERLLARSLRGRPDAIVATKGGQRRSGEAWLPCGDPATLRRACEASLQALRRESIALYQLHKPDPLVPFAESVGALAELRREGKIVHIGLSNVTPEQLDEAAAIAPIAAVQNRMNLIDRASLPVLRRCERLGIAFIPYSPLSGRTRADPLGRYEPVATLAARRGVAPQQLALAWLLRLSPAIVPIPGCSRIASVTGCAEATDIALTAEEMRVLDSVAAAAGGNGEAAG